MTKSSSRPVVRLSVVAASVAALSLAPLATLAVSAAPASPAAQAAKCSVCGHNLIKNGGAEAGKGSTEDTKVAVPDWKAHGNFTAATYKWEESDISPKSPGPKKRGKNYFYGGPEGARHASGTQVISLAHGGAGGGKVGYTLRGWLGGYSSQRDNAVLTATFENKDGKALSTATIGPVTPGQRKDVSKLMRRSIKGTVPAHATQVVVVLTLTRYDASDDDGMADDLSLVLSTK